MPSSRTPPTWVAVAILFLVAFAAFWPVLGSQFSQWDDVEQIAVNPYLNPPMLKGLARRWAAPFMSIYIPFTHTVWFLLALIAQGDVNAAVRELHPLPFKLANLLIHIGTSSIVFLILSKLAQSRWIALVGACLYCLHPVQVETVAWASGTKDLLFGFFGCLCFFYYVGDAETGFRLTSRANVCAVIAMVLACLSKPTALVMPAMLLVGDLWIAKRNVRNILTRLLPFVIIAIACAVYARIAQPALKLDIQLTPLDRVLVPAHSLAFYVYKLFWPNRLAFDYGVNWFSLLGSRSLHFAWMVPTAIAVVAFAIRKRIPLFGVGLLLAIIPIAPVSGIVLFDYSYYSITSDHYLYLPMLGVAIAVVALLERFPKTLIPYIVVPVLVVLGGLTVRQSLFWKTQHISTLHTLAVNPQSFSSYSILAILEVAQSGGDPQKLALAERYARQAIAMRPDNARSQNMLAIVLSAQGRYEEALVEIEKALTLSPTDRQYHLAKAGILGEMQRGEEAIAELRLVLRYDPDNRLATELVEKWDAIVQREGRISPTPATAPVRP